MTDYFARALNYRGEPNGPGLVMTGAESGSSSLPMDDAERAEHARRVEDEARSAVERIQADQRRLEEKRRAKAGEIRAPNATQDLIEATPSAAPGAAPAHRTLAPPVDYFSRALGIQKAPAAGGEPKVVDPNAEPDATTWIGRRIQDIRGKKDPRFADLPVFDPEAEGFTVEQKAPVAAGYVLGNTDEGMGDVFAKQLGDRYLGRTKDANGYEIVLYKDRTGQKAAAYVNKPGLDLHDVARGVAGSVPYLIGGATVGGLAKAARTGVRALAQAAGGAATNAVTQAARPATGSDQNFDPWETIAAGAFAGGAEMMSSATGAAIRKFITEPSLFDKAAGRLTERGAAAAREAGLDPAQMDQQISQAFAKAFARTGDAIEAGTTATAKGFNIPVTKGQATKDKYLLDVEESMRRRGYGEDAQALMSDFDKRQAEAVKTAALGGSDGERSIATRIAPDRNPGARPVETMPSTLGTSIKQGVTAAKEGAKAAEGAAWREVPKLEPSQEALSGLAPHLNAALGNTVVDENTKVAASMVQRIGQFVRGEAPKQVDEILTSSPVRDVDRMRRQLLGMMKGAEGEDARAAGAVYDAFNGWIEQAAAKHLLSGDASAAAKLVSARGMTREVKELFEPKTPSGTLTPGAQRMKKVMETADTPEAVVDALFGTQGSRGINQGSVEALRSFKTALERFADRDTAMQTWNDMRLAYWTRLVVGRNGEMLGPQAIVTNVKTALQNQRTVLETLFTTSERVEIALFLKAVEAAAYKPPNASGSGYTAGRLMKEGVEGLLNAFGLGRIARGALELSGVADRYGASVARDATRQLSRAANPVLGGYGAAAGRIHEQNQPSP